MTVAWRHPDSAWFVATGLAYEIDPWGIAEGWTWLRFWLSWRTLEDRERERQNSKGKIQKGNGKGDGDRGNWRTLDWALRELGVQGRSWPRKAK